MADPLNPYGQQDYSNASTALGQSSNLYNNSAASYDNAAARVRNRVNAQGNANAQDITNKYQQRGLGNSGLQQNSQARNFQGTQQAYAGGLVDLQNNFANQNIQRAQGLSQVGNQYANIGQAKDTYGTAYRGQDLSHALGLGEQALTQRGQDLNQESTLRNQDIQDKLGGYNILRDILGAQYEFGDTRLSTSDQGTVDQIINRLLNGTVG